MDAWNFGDAMKKPAPAQCAFITELFGIKSLVAAMNRNMAKATTFQAARDAGYIFKYTDIRVKRAPEHDAWAETAQRRCYGLEEVNGANP